MQKPAFSNSFLLISGLALCLCSAQGHAQTITINDPVRFGKISMRNNSAPRELRLLTDGGYIADPAYVIHASEPELGRVTITGYPVNHPMDITIDVASTVIGISGGGGAPATFTLVDPFTVPATVTTDMTGSATFEVGATLRSDGSGNTYIDASYLGSFDVTVVPQ